MGRVTITVLQGADRGRVFRDLQTPITIGREEGNTIQLNDERVSRCHLKIQQDSDKMVLTDLDSTNGTKVNGEDCQLRNLRSGDIVAVGRSLIRIGTDAEIAERLAKLQADSGIDRGTVRDLAGLHPPSGNGTGVPGPAQLGQTVSDQILAILGMVEPPEIPDNLTAGQAAQVCEILDYVHTRLRWLVESGQVDEQAGQVRLPVVAWQRLLDAQARLSHLVRRLADPEWSP